MSKILKLTVLLLSFNCCFAQQKDDTFIDIEFTGETYKEALEILKIKTNTRIFYAKSWLPEKSIYKSYHDTTLESILEDLFEQTNLNIYNYKDHGIVITENNLIYDHLPAGFFPLSSVANSTLKDSVMYRKGSNNDIMPVFYQDITKNNSVETIRIGKQTRDLKSYYKLSGHIYNKTTKEPISNLSLIVANTNRGVTTDIDGFYEILLPPGENIVKTRSLTNENLTKRIIIFDSGVLDFELEENLQFLDEVQLFSNADQNITNANSGEEEIDVENIKNIPLVLGERDIMKVATTLPGISKAGEGSAGYNVRGGKEDQNLILLDDAVMYNPSHFFGLFSAINPFTSGEVNIFKGNIPAKYGGRLSSVFDIKTKDSNTQEFEGEASLGPLTSNLTIQLPIVKEKSGLMVGARSTYSDWILRSLDDESLKNSSAFFYDGIVKYNHKFNAKNKVSLTGYLSKDQFSITSDSLYSFQNQLFSLHYNHTFNQKNKAELIFTNSNYKFNIDYESNFDDDFESGYQINETEVKLNFDNFYSSVHHFNYGISGKLYDIDPGYIKPMEAESSLEYHNVADERGLEYAIWFSDELKISDKLSFNAGMRYSFFTSLGPASVRYYNPDAPKTGNTVEGNEDFKENEPIVTYSGPEIRIGGRYSFSPDLSLKASFNNTYQYIHTLSNNTTVSPTDTYRLSGYHIKPQQGKQYSLGLYKNFNNNTIETNIEGFYKRSNNIIDFKTGANLFLNDYVETEAIQGKGKSYGVEFLIKKKTGKLNGWLAYTYSRSYFKLKGEFKEEQVNNGKFFPSNYDKPHDFSLVANYKITQRYSFSGNFIYQTGRPITYPVGKYSFDGNEYVMYSDRNQFRIPDYYRLDLSFNMEGNHKLNKLGHSFWSFSVYNVLGRNNPYSVYFVTKEGKVEGRQSSIFSVPVPTISFNFQF